MKILHASREFRADYRYGMGRANALLLDGLGQNGIPTDFVCSSDLDKNSIQRVTRWTERLAKFFPKALFPILNIMVTAWETGRMAGRHALAHGHTHLHCHDTVVAAGARSVLQRTPSPVGLVSTDITAFHMACINIYSPCRSGLELSYGAGNAK